jgi:hypothetical protein
MTSEIDAYRAKADDYDHKAATLGKRNAPIREYYQRLAQHWRSLAALAQERAERQKSGRNTGSK